MNAPLLLVVALAAQASNVNVETPRSNNTGNGGNVGAVGSAVTPGGTSGNALGVGPATLQGGLPGAVNTPDFRNAAGPAAGMAAPASAANNSGAPNALPAVTAPNRGRVTAPPASPAAASALANPAANDAPAGAAVLGADLGVPGAKPAATEAAAQKEGLRAGVSLSGVNRDLDVSRSGAARVDGLNERAVLDKTFDSMRGGAALAGRSGASRNEVAGQLQSLRGYTDQALDLARQAPPADAPAHYQSLLGKLKDALTPSAFKSMEKAIKGIAAVKADPALNELAGEAYRAAAAGQKKEVARLLKGFDSWESLLGAPGRPLVANGATLQADVRRRLDAAVAGSGSAAPQRTFWFERRGDRYVASLPGSALERLSPSLALGFALKPSAIPSLGEGLDAAWRAYAANPTVTRGFAEVFRGRRERGSWLSAVAAATGFSLRSLLYRAWLFVRSFFVSSSYALNTPSGAAKLRADLALQAEVAKAGAEVRAALTVESPTVGSVRSALAALGRQAAAHEKLQGRLARSGASALASSFASATAGVPDSEPLDDAMVRFAFGADGVLRQSQAMSSDASAAIDGRVFAGGAAGLRHTEGSRLWAMAARRGGNVTLSADLRGTAAGGFVDLRAPGDEAVASRLAELGFVTRLDGGVVTATLDSDALDLSADRLAPLAQRALSAAGAQ